MQQAVFEKLVGEVRAVRAATVREAADIERFVREYPPLKMPPIKIASKGRDLGPMYVVTAQGCRAVDFTPGGKVDRKLRALVERIKHKRHAQN